MIYENNYTSLEKFKDILDEDKIIWQRVESGLKQYQALPQSKEKSELWEQFLVEWNEWKKDNEDILILI
ncbi:hypothetical protein [Aliarcobacter skirrowii]|uniref:hypothetical protein n=1 Tax=Aliarcobacter skirrowii TaxID=28200 RepID=UPI0029BA2578|nr:hypothetical protein [Aliarcobacter skirrowii]MDX4035708.1 hypothetical protein [Aliarcobacter skirrowii]